MSRANKKFIFFSQKAARRHKTARPKPDCLIKFEGMNGVIILFLRTADLQPFLKSLFIERKKFGFFRQLMLDGSPYPIPVFHTICGSMTSV